MRWTDVGGIRRGAVPVWIENVGGTVLSHEPQTRPMCRVKLGGTKESVDMAFRVVEQRGGSSAPCCFPSTSRWSCGSA